MRTREGESLIPSVVLFADDRTIVGREAQLRGRAHSDRLAACAKRLLGEAFYDHQIGGESIPPEVLQACILQQVKREWVGQDSRQSRVVIAVPATALHGHPTSRALPLKDVEIGQLVPSGVRGVAARALVDLVV